MDPRRRRTRSASGSPTTPRTRWATSCSSTCPRSAPAVEAAASISEVESTKSVSDIYAPVSGTVTEVNTDLADAPERLNEDPYGEGWICVIELSDAAAARQAPHRRRLPGAGRGLAGMAEVSLPAVRAPEPAGRHGSARRAAPASTGERTTPPCRSPSRRQRRRRRGRGRPRRAARRRGDARGHPGPELRARSYALDEPLVTAGRHPDSVIFLDDITVSRRHAEVRQVDAAATRWPTWAPSTAPTSTASGWRRRPLKDGDELQIGTFKLLFLAGRP